MTEKLPTIDIKGKQYVLVKDRILAFNEMHKAGAIKTELCTAPESKLIVIKATVTPDIAKPERMFTGYSQAIMGTAGVNATAALENAETSAVGRALAMMGIGVLESVASADEIRKSNATIPKVVTPSANYVRQEPKIKKHNQASELEQILKPCDKCGGDFQVKSGRNGDFFGCSGYPKCKRTMNLEDAQMWKKPEYMIAESMGGNIMDDGAPLPDKEF